jgi:hypothetical protein
MPCSRRKGKDGELAACHELRDRFGFHCHRTQQRTGWSDGDSPDIEVDELPEIFWEIKRVERLNVGRALALAVRQSGRRCPVIMHRPNRSVNGWMLTLRLEDLPRLCHAYTTATDREIAEGSAVAKEDAPSAQASGCAGGRVAARAARSVHPR